MEYGQCVLVVGRSGSGKTYSLRNLTPKDTIIVMSKFKPLVFKNWKNNFSINKLEKDKGFIKICKNFENLNKFINILVTKKLPFKNIIFDDFQYYSQLDVFTKADEKGFDKFIGLAMNIQKSLDLITTLPYILGTNIAIFWHSNTETLAEEKGTLVQTSSKFIDEKFLVEGIFNTVLKTEIVDGYYKFKTNSDNNLLSIKSPAGVFDLYIDNDLNYVFNQLNKFDRGEL